MPDVAGVRLASAHSGMRYKNRDDVFLAVFPEGTSVAGCFTKNKMPGEPVKWGRAILPSGKARGLVVNAGYANVWTGEQGYAVVEETAAAAASLIGCSKEEIHISSTGIIGEQIKKEKLLGVLPGLYRNLSEKKWEEAARAFMTTDTFPKGVTKQAKIGNAKVNINGILKGSGMVAPNMATALCFVFTDAKIPAPILQQLISGAVDKSLNSTTVDGDTSTSDTCLVFATGQVKHEEISAIEQDGFADFKRAFNELMVELAHLLVKDGEGISKFVTINIKGAITAQSARIIGLSIANSPLVKTAIAAQDPNWGRIVAAIGKSGEPIKETVDIWIGDELVAINGSLNPNYKEANAAEHMKNPEINITVDVDSGDAEATVWTCDLTEEYIKINANYRS